MSEQQQASPVHYVYITVIAVLVTAFTFYVIQNRSDEKYRKAMEETITTTFTRLGGAAQAQGHVVDYAQIAQLVKANMAPELMAEIQRQNGTINNIALAVGEVKGKISELKQPTNTERMQDGSFKATLEQNRDGLPPLTSVSLAYDAKDPNMKTALRGQWIPNNEVFSLKFVKWTGENGGFRSAAQLERTVKDPTTGKQIGQSETIPITSNDSFFLKDDLRHVAPFPKYSLFIGSAIDTKTGQKTIAVIGDKYFTPNWSFTTGYVNKAGLIGMRYTWGKQ